MAEGGFIVLRKQIVEGGTKPLPDDVAERLQGFNGNVDQLLINLNADTLRTYLQEEYGTDLNLWLSPLQRMIDNRDRMTKWEHEAVKRVILEVDGKETTT